MKSQDIIILATICERAPLFWTQKELATHLKISQAEISYSFTRMEKSKLYDKKNQMVMLNGFLEFLRYGLPYVFPAETGTEKIGIPLKQLDGMHSKRKVVWEYEYGTDVGLSLTPLFYDKLPEAIMTHKYLLQSVSWIEWLRIGSSREKDIAFQSLKNLWTNYGK
jgi:hypothetical protein